MSDVGPRTLVGTAPGYTLLLSDLRRRVRAGEWRPGDQIPSERELCEEYGVSRTMVRQTLGLAEREGLFVKVPGRGTFVGGPRIRQELSAMTTFGSTVAAHGLAAHRRVLHQEWTMPTAELAERLRVPRTENVFYVEMLSVAGTQPIAYYQSYTPASVAEPTRLPEIVQRGEVGARSVPELTAAMLGIEQLIADQLYEAVVLDEDSAAQLEALPGSPAFRVTSVFLSSGQTVLGAAVVCYLADRYTFHLTRTLDIAPDQAPASVGTDGDGSSGVVSSR